MIDGLAHLHDPRVSSDLADLLHAAAVAGVTDIVNGNAPLSAPRPTAPGGMHVWRAVGVHPRDVTAAWSNDVEAVRLAASSPDVVAIGEVGLDGRDGMPASELQEAALVAQLQLARDCRLPAIVHCVDLRGRLLDLLAGSEPLEAGFTLHAFAGPAEMVPRWVELGAYFSFGGLVTRPEAKKCHKAAAAVPQTRLLVESDTPDMWAAGWEGPSAPAMVPHVLAALARLRNEPLTALAHATAQNARRLYKLAQPSKIDAT